MSEKTRCSWSISHDLLTHYHDTEWGVPVYDDRKLFEFMVLDSAQAGLSWLTVLKKREGYRAAFAAFNPVIVASFSDADIEMLLENPEIIRNRAKVRSSVTNAQAFLAVQEEFSGFAPYIWSFVNGKTIDHTCQRDHDILVTSPESDAMSKDLVKRGFKFVGSTICYAFMQAAGLVNDHTADCFRYLEIQRTSNA